MGLSSSRDRRAPPPAAADPDAFAWILAAPLGGAHVDAPPLSLADFEIGPLVGVGAAARVHVARYVGGFGRAAGPRGARARGGPDGADAVDARFCALKIVDKRRALALGCARQLRWERACMLACDEAPGVLRCLGSFQDEARVYLCLRLLRRGWRQHKGVGACLGICARPGVYGLLAAPLLLYPQVELLHLLPKLIQTMFGHLDALRQLRLGRDPGSHAFVIEQPYLFLQPGNLRFMPRLQFLELALKRLRSRRHVRHNVTCCRRSGGIDTGPQLLHTICEHCICRLRGCLFGRLRCRLRCALAHTPCFSTP